MFGPVAVWAEDLEQVCGGGVAVALIHQGAGKLVARLQVIGIGGDSLFKATGVDIRRSRAGELQSRTGAGDGRIAGKRVRRGVEKRACLGYLSRGDKGTGKAGNHFHIIRRHVRELLEDGDGTGRSALAQYLLALRDERSQLGPGPLRLPPDGSLLQAL